MTTAAVAAWAAGGGGAAAGCALAADVLAGSSRDDLKMLLSAREVAAAEGRGALEGIARALAAVGVGAGAAVFALRRTQAVGCGMWVNFHVGEAGATAQVPLGDVGCAGGELMCLTAGGEAVAHAGDVVHGVARLEAGVRYGLYALAGQSYCREPTLEDLYLRIFLRGVCGLSVCNAKGANRQVVQRQLLL